LTHPAYAAAAAEIARLAGRLLLDFFKRGVETEYKGSGTVDLVTAADRASEALIAEVLQQRFPTHSILGEEGTRREQAGDFQWYVDPLDGTTNFAHGFPVFCVSLGLTYKDELIAGAIYDPTRDEMFTAEKGAGAQLNDRPIHVSKAETLGVSLLATGFPSKKRHQNPNIHFYHQLTLRSHGVRRAGSAALDLTCVASGRYDAFWEFHLNPWDTAAGVLLVQEAGGVVTCFDGSPFRLQSDEVLASNRVLHPELMRFFADVFAGRNLEDLPAIARSSQS
jgi:myo-inositol-1(or 4)-monophosphatase